MSPSPSVSSEPKVSDEQPSLTDLAGGSPPPVDAPPPAPPAQPLDAPPAPPADAVDGESGGEPAAASLAPPPVSASLAAAAADQPPPVDAPPLGTPFNFSEAGMLASTAKAEAAAAALAPAAAPKASAVERDPTELPVHELRPDELESERVRLEAYRQAIAAANDKWLQAREAAEQVTRDAQKLISDCWVARQTAENNFQPVKIAGRLARIEDLIKASTVPPPRAA